MDGLTAKIRYPVLATIGSDGMPSLSVMWALIEPDGTVLMNTARGRQKDLDMLRDPRVSLCFEDRCEYVTLEGTVAMRDDPTSRISNACATTTATTPTSAHRAPRG